MVVKSATGGRKICEAKRENKELKRENSDAERENSEPFHLTKIRESTACERLEKLKKELIFPRFYPRWKIICKISSFALYFYHYL